jgi:hypothetical protein
MCSTQRRRSSRESLAGPVWTDATVAAGPNPGAVSRSTRASDEDRERVVRQLSEHTAAGRLSLTEFSDRVSAVYGATLVSDLDQVLSDLPVVRVRREVGQPAVTATTWLGGSRGGPWMPWLLTGAICLAIWVVSSLAQERVLYFWPVWMIGPWGVAIFWRVVTGRGGPRSLAPRPYR